MQHGFIKVCAATPEIRVADVKYNSSRIISAIKESAANGSRLTVFPELCLCGYTCGDLFNQSVLLNACETAIDEIAKSTKGLKTLVFVGAPFSNGGKLYNCAFAIYNGLILGIVPKTYLPDYGEFYEKRYFCSAPDKLEYIDYKCNGENYSIGFGTQQIFKADNCRNFSVACEICEDLWAPLSPSVNHVRAGADIIVNLSCSDETVGKADYRKNLIKTQSAKLICGYIYCDAGDGESTTDMVFSGHNLICENGSILSESKLFENGLLYGEIDTELLFNERKRIASGYFRNNDLHCDICKNDYNIAKFETEDKPFDITRNYSKTPFVPEDGIKLKERTELILTIQQKGLEKRLKHVGCKSVVLGVSGGLDSALALLVACRTFASLGWDKKNIIAVSMPAFGTTEKTKSNALKLIAALGATSRVIPVGDTVLKHFKDIGHDADNKNVTYENAQARMRTMVLMDIANDENGIVLGTGDLSELALGWATYSGDHMSMYGVNASVPKTLVKHLIAYEAEKLGGETNKILTDILNTEISPELLPPDKNGNIAQKTEDIVGPYVLHDFFIYYSLRYGFSPSKIKFLAVKSFKGVYDEETIDKWLKSFYKRFFKHQFKRSCAPDGVKVGSVSLSPRADLRLPSDAVAALWLDELK